MIKLERLTETVATTTRYTTRWALTHARSTEVEGRLVRQVNRYFEEGPWRSRNPDSIIGVRYHRRLSTILNAVIDAGLVIEHLEEPPGDAGAIERAPIYGEVAEVLVGKAAKPGGRAALAAGGA